MKRRSPMRRWSSRSRKRKHWIFFNDTATTEIYTLSLHDALPIWDAQQAFQFVLRDLGKDALLELQQEPRHGEEDGGPGPVQVGEEGIDPFAEEDAISQVDGRSFHPGPLHDEIGRAACR